LNNFRKNNNKEKNKELQNFRIQVNYLIIFKKISKRITEIDQFYEDNIHDIRIFNFEKARLRLKKLMMFDEENLNHIEKSYNEFITKQKNESQVLNTFQNSNIFNEQ
jgi:hypothetical protein